MNKARTIISLAVLTIGLLGSCSKINERLDGLDKRINNLENDKIASVEQQIAAINQSIADLGTIRTNIQTLMDAKEAQGEDITTLKAKDQELEGKINDLKAYVDTELAKYATKDWANATFATLAKQAEIIADITKLKQDLAGLDAALDQNIEDLDSSLKVWVNEQLSAYSTTAQMEAKVKALQDQIDALKADNETNKSDIEDLEADLAQLEQDLESAKATIKTAYEKAIKDALESNNGYITEKIKRAISSANGSISSLSSRVGTLETQVEALRGDVDALKEMIQSVTIIPAYSDGSVEAVNGILELNLVVSPSSAAKGLTKDNVKILLNKVATKAVSVGTVKTENISSFIVDVTNGTVEIKANISENLPTEDGQALTVAVNVANGISDFTTEFVPVTVTTKPIETVTFDLNGITGTAPEKQKVAKDGKVTKPTDPTDQVHTFAGWYKTKDATTGALSDPWDFDNGTVTADMTLYAKWTRTLESIYSNSDIPKVTNNTAPTNAWVNINDSDCKAYIAYSTGNTILTLYKKLDPDGAKQMSCKKTELFTKVGDDYVFPYGTQYGVFTLHMTGGKFTSVTYNGAGTDYSELSGTYTAPVSKDYVEIAAKYDGSTLSTLRWYKQNLAITDSGKKAWKSDSGSAVKVPGTDKDVIVGDYFQWGTFTGFYGNDAGTDKGLLPYTSFTSTGCGDGSDAFTFKDGKQFNQTNAPYWSGSAYTKYNAKDKKTKLDASDDVASIILGGTWRMPTSAEIIAMKAATYWKWDATDKGYYVFIPLEGDEGKINNETSNTYNKADALLFFPTAGNGYLNTYYDVESIADYWASSLNSTFEEKACHLFFNDSGSVNADSRDSERFRGFSVRPVQDPKATYKAVTSVSLNETSKNITVGGNLQLKATVIPDDATQQGVYWTSDKPAVATVDPYGKVTGVAAGTATITATTVDGSKTASCTVTVSAPQVTVTFDLNGITGTAPTPQIIEKGGKVTIPTNPTYDNHTFAGWYKTKDATTGALSDPWDFGNDIVTADMTLYAKWTRTLVSIYTNSDIPKVEDNTAPDNAWENGDKGKAFIAYSGKTSEILCLNKKLEPSGAYTMSCKTTEKFTKIGDDYVFSYGTQYGVFTLHMTDGKFTSVTYNGAGTDYSELSGTYAAPTPTTTGTAKRTGDIDVKWIQLWENGPKFAEYNVGATSATEYGEYYAWGGSQNKVDDHNTGSSALSGDSDTATKLWGSNWRMPTKAEFDNLFAKCDVKWIDGSKEKYNNTDVKGLLCTGKDAYSSNSVFLPTAGYCKDGSVLSQGNFGYYWSSTPPTGGNSAYCLLFYSDYQGVGSGNRVYGYSVRAVLVE